MGRAIKYMGTSDVQLLNEGWDGNGQLPKSIGVEVRWDWDNNHVIDTDDYPKVPEEAWDVLAENEEFLDVTGMKRIPRSAGEDMWRPVGSGGSETPEGTGAPAMGSTEVDAENAGAEEDDKPKKGKK